ncbi:hypothetical protein [Motilibacter aurantiacus]|uniref:hypothetical protein n=1 Tax=Motilibacter aurantiacus TaxID=2714955 RepID=UPI00140C9D44|nr:hypothetical protein [Motilibacter aurantiacus]NHC47132.1 hypothetical protein [Motilibacter aurantiacus]
MNRRDLWRDIGIAVTMLICLAGALLAWLIAYTLATGDLGGEPSRSAGAFWGAVAGLLFGLPIVLVGLVYGKRTHALVSLAWCAALAAAGAFAGLLPG